VPAARKRVSYNTNSGRWQTSAERVLRGALLLGVGGGVAAELLAVVVVRAFLQFADDLQLGVCRSAADHRDVGCAGGALVLDAVADARVPRTALRTDHDQRDDRDGHQEAEDRGAGGTAACAGFIG
jgi:hypothetical protein